MMSPSNRLRARDIKTILKLGRTVPCDQLVFKFIAASALDTSDVPPAITGVHPRSRFAFIVGKVVSKKAVVRNKLRRRLRSAVCAIAPNLKKNVDGIFITRTNAATLTYSDIQKLVVRVFNKTGLI